MHPLREKGGYVSRRGHCPRGKAAPGSWPHRSAGCGGPCSSLVHWPALKFFMPDYHTDIRFARTFLAVRGSGEPHPRCSALAGRLVSLGRSAASRHSLAVCRAGGSTHCQGMSRSRTSSARDKSCCQRTARLGDEAHRSPNREKRPGKNIQCDNGHEEAQSAGRDPAKSTAPAPRASLWRRLPEMPFPAGVTASGKRGQPFPEEGARFHLKKDFLFPLLRRESNLLWPTVFSCFSISASSSPGTSRLSSR